MRFLATLLVLMLFAPAGCGPSENCDNGTCSPADEPRNTDQRESDATILAFHAAWCGHCKNMEPVEDSLLDHGYPLERHDIDRERDLARKFEVRSIPCYVVVRGGREMGRRTGEASWAEMEKFLGDNDVQPRR